MDTRAALQAWPLTPAPFDSPPAGLSAEELGKALVALLCLERRARALRVDLIAETRRRGLPCDAKLGVRDILALSPEPLLYLTPASR